MNRIIPIAMVCDRNFIMQTFVTIVSMKENKSAEYIYDIYILSSVSCVEFEEYASKIRSTDFLITIIEVSMDKFKKIKQISHISQACLLKFEISDYLVTYDKVLYLDGDIIVRKGLETLFQIELGENYVACVFHSLGIVTGEDKMNGGVMLLNVAKIREKNLSRILLKKREELGDRNSMDQETFQLIFADKKIALSPQYNIMVDKLDFEKKFYSIKDFNTYYGTSFHSRREALRNAVIVHFTGAIKPWKYSFGKCNKEWCSYYSKLDDKKLVRKNRLDYYKEIKNKNGFRGLYWMLKDRILIWAGGIFHIYLDKSYEMWN